MASTSKSKSKNPTKNPTAKKRKAPSTENESQEVTKRMFRGKIREEITFRHTFDDVYELEGSYDEKESPEFYCWNVPWTITIQMSKWNQNYYMSTYLHCKAKEPYALNGSYELRLLQAKTTNKPYTKKRQNHVFKKYNDHHGFTNFILLDHIISDYKNKYAKDGTVTMEVNLKVTEAKK